MIESRTEGPLTFIHMDDGGNNIFTLDRVVALRDALKAAEADSAQRVVILEGNAKALSVGLDTKTVAAGGADAEKLLAAMGEVLSLLYLSRLMSVVVAQGHATAAGAMLLLTADHRIGVEGPGKIGLSEVRVGLPVPVPTQQLVRDRITTKAQFATTALAQLCDYETAHAIGFVDQLAPTVEAAQALAVTKAEALLALNEAAYHTTKQDMRRAFAKLVGG